MHSTHPASLLCVLLTTVTIASCQTTRAGGPTEAQPPQVTAPQRGSSPVLQSVTLRRDIRAANGRMINVVPDYHFIDADGDVVLLRREIVETNGSLMPRSGPEGPPIYTAAEFQKKGAIFNGGGWTCGTAQYYVKMRAWLIDAAGNQSNKVEFTYHCNGG